MEDWMGECDLEARIEALEVRVTIAEGEALFASHLLQRLLSGLVTAGVLPKREAERFADEVLFIMERHDVVLADAGLLTERARTRLQETLTGLAGLP